MAAIGIRQGDPLSPLLFCLAEDVISRGLYQLLSNNRLTCIKSSRNVHISSHTVYADDIMLFTKVCSSSLDAIAELFDKYAVCSCQICNPTKSILLSGSMSAVKHGFLANKIGFQMGFLPFLYFGCHTPKFFLSFSIFI